MKPAKRAFSCRRQSRRVRVRRSDETRRVGDGTVAPPGAAEARRGRDSDKSPRGDSSLHRLSCSRVSAPFNPPFSCPFVFARQRNYSPSAQLFSATATSRFAAPAGVKPSGNFTLLTFETSLNFFASSFQSPQ